LEKISDSDVPAIVYEPKPAESAGDKQVGRRA